MKYHDLQVASKKSAKRVGRGIAAGQGKTAGRGTKGQGARAGYSKKPGFEGGQTPLMQHLPKLRGFRSMKPKAEVIYTEQLNSFGAKVDTTTLAEKGLISSAYVNVKLLKRGNVTKKVEVKLQGASETAITAVQEAGGSFEKTPRLARPTTKKKSEDK